VPPFPHEKSHRITLDEAKEMCRGHRVAAGKGEGYLRAGAFGRAVLDEILAQPACTGLRIYLGRNKEGDSTLVAVGIDANGEDLVTGTIANDLWPCPPFCPDGEALDT
jgi:hypothetical protein